MVEDRFGINVCVDDKNHLLDQGQIFVFNHFARFEAVIPIYFIYKATGAFTRTIADYRLFSFGEKFNQFLRNGGAVPNNLEGLLPFLAAEILRGRKVVIFPEGGMVKDRQVYHKNNGFQLISGLSGNLRKQHRGAAVLALTLDLFKERIKDLHERGDVKRLEHWRDALEIESIEKLLEEAYRPTLICPGNITFYPMRIKQNMISRAVKFFVRKLPEQLAEELTIEGNILLKDTDMDIRFTKSIEVKPKLGWIRKQMLRHFFNQIDSLEEFFTLSQQKDGFITRFFVRFMYTETHSIRDKYMALTYTNLTINTSHIAATLMTTLYKHHKESILREEFEYLVEQSIQELQKNSNVKLHKSISNTSEKSVILKELKTFYETITFAKLAKVTKTEIEILSAIGDDSHTLHQVRLKNPIRVFVNEAKPITAVRHAILIALRHAQHNNNKISATAQAKQGAAS